ncbi:MAG TPA: class I SAM-dependent methyltransferase [Dokdonella sp.]|uniref:class I SAM-dependent methyltransferase n=1 Tax=Dokdonella sp. TaxID=2291710 RepID=UPI0025BDDF30|nr:class I SAM-dependent methyltransferase [Dokdonella sp.]MBX3690798.1 class I SAM-dependent methyltransferase [Dokdonella sp.]HNR91673.1 class I SAM-dependent methyltransferase [Dokdonella sp.]
MSESTKPMAFTGERFTPECVREIWYEHWHRYAFALPLVSGRRVLDAACGEGYGSALLARHAASVVGVDISPQAIEHARLRYGGASNLRFDTGDAAALEFQDASFDIVVSFETLEHLEAQQALVAGFARVLADDGLLLISSPDKRSYSDHAGFRNEFHVRELYREELLELLSPHFPHVRLYAQKLLFQSILWRLDGEMAPSAVATAAADGAEVATTLDYVPLYYVAACSRRPLPVDLPGLSLFGDREESVYAHYNGEVRKNMSAGARIAELEAELEAARRAPIVAQAPWWRRWLGR